MPGSLDIMTYKMASSSAIISIAGPLWSIFESVIAKCEIFSEMKSSVGWGHHWINVIHTNETLFM